MERLVIGGCTLVDVDNHRGFSSATEKGLEELGEFAFSERNIAIFCSNRKKKSTKRPDELQLDTEHWHMLDHFLYPSV